MASTVSALSPAAALPVISTATTLPVPRPAPARPERALCPDPVFILGAPRSGTSILVWALAQHPEFWGSAESNMLYHLFGDGHLGRCSRDCGSSPEQLAA